MRLLPVFIACTALAGNLPLSFEPARRKSKSEVSYLTRSGSYNLFLDSGESVLVGKGTSTLRTKLAGSDPAARLVPEGPQTSVSNYFVGNDPNRWRTSVPNFEKIRYVAIYPGIDLVYYGREGNVEYDWILSPGADSRRIRMVFEGADRLRIDRNGDLVIKVGKNEYRHRKPVAYQEAGSKRIEIAGAWNLHDKEGSFRLGPYDHEKPLTIDPTLAYATYLGGTGTDYAYAVAVDSAGNTYITGGAGSTDFPTTSPEQGARDGQNDVFITKINAAGTAKIYSTYLGGGGVDEGKGIAVDSAGNAYVTGSAGSFDFPLKNPIQGIYGGSGDVFVTKIDAAGAALVYSTYLGGNSQDYGTAIAVDLAGIAYVAGVTFSANFPTVSPFQSAKGALEDAFVAKINAAGSAWVYSTYLGGNDADEAYGIAADAAGNAYVTGKTFSTNFPLQSAIRSAVVAGDAFVTKINPTGSALVFSTYFGGSAADTGNAIAVDSTGVYVAGSSVSLDLPVVNAFQPRIGGPGQDDVFVAKLNPSGSALIYCTYLGGGSSDEAYGVAVDAAGNAWITGRTNSSDFPLKNTMQSSRVAFEMFVTELTLDGSSILFSTFYGGTGSEVGQGIAVDSAGNVHVAGQTTSTDLQTVNALQQRNGGNTDAVVLLFGNATITPPQAGLTITKTHDASATRLRTLALYFITVSNPGSSPTNGTVTVTETVPAGEETLISMGGPGWTCPTGGVACTRSDPLAPGTSYAQITVTVLIAENAPAVVTNLASVSVNGQVATVSDPTQTLPAPPHFFDGATPVAGSTNVFFLKFPNGNVFGYYTYRYVDQAGNSQIGHFDMGEVFFYPNATQSSAAIYDFNSRHQMLTSSNFPLLYDLDLTDTISFGPFTLNLPGIISYLADPNNANRYTMNPRLFRKLFSGTIFAM